MEPDIDKAIIFFDGVCNLCNSSVQFIIKHDKKHRFVFAALQSDVARDILLHYPTKITKKDSILLLQDNQLYSESSAALRILKQFSPFWYVFQIFWIVPKFIRDSIYRFIAKNRYSWFGKRSSCMVPTKDILKKFL